MNDLQKIRELFQLLKPGSRQIGFFNQRNGNWCRASLKGVQESKVLIECPGLEEFPSPFVFLGQLAFSFSRRYSFIASLTFQGETTTFKTPTFMLPITKVLGEEEHSSKRESYRVKPDEEESVISFYNLLSGSAQDFLKGELTDVSAGGLGLSIDMHTLQGIGEGDQFMLIFDLSTSKEVEEHIEMVATLRNARPLRHQRVQLGFSFHPDSNPEIDFKIFNKKLGSYIALRQRQILKKRISTRDESRL